MPIDERVTLVTDRDLDILAALDMSPLTAEQLMKLSVTFTHPFPDPRRVRERLRRFVEAERVRAFRYATTGPGAPLYYVLSPLGYRLLHGHAAELPARRTFESVGVARQRHTHALAEFLVHTAVAAHEAGIRLTNHDRENTIRLEAGGVSFYPDMAFRLLTQDGRSFQFFIELDCRSERIHSEKTADSWQRKIKLYESYADQSKDRFRVLVVVVGGAERLGHIVALAAQSARNPQRSLFYGITLDAFRGVAEAVTSLCWIDHRGVRVPLVPTASSQTAAGGSARQSRGG